MKNITLSIDDELYERSRVVAAQRKTTVTGLVREHLRGLSDAEERRERARQELQAVIGRFGGKVGRMPTREERHAQGIRLRLAGGAPHARRASTLRRKPTSQRPFPRAG